MEVAGGRRCPCRRLRVLGRASPLAWLAARFQEQQREKREREEMGDGRRDGEMREKEEKDGRRRKRWESEIKLVKDSVVR